MTLPEMRTSGVAPSLHSLPPKGSAGGDGPPSGVRSMTGYAQITRQLAQPAGRLTMELRSVNSRFLDLSLKIPESLRGLESGIRTKLQQAFKRGKMELKLSWYAQTSLEHVQELDESLIAHWRAHYAKASELFPALLPPSFSDLVTLSRSHPIEPLLEAQDPALETQVSGVLEELMAQFEGTRSTEGLALAKVVQECASKMRMVVAQVKKDLPAHILAAQQKLSARMALAMAGQTADQSLQNEVAERIRQEVAAVGLKADVAEEVERLFIHITELESLSSSTKEVGKRLDFLCQELNREANTLGSKAIALSLTNASIELKLLIEQIREQAQNFE